ncbi:MAG: non-heme iron oxygenase ferredoxin subunit [Gammaproteobacteria bacterium]|nr:non-heme iron oxygenase ferredoxin subunit [Gammaproteobacteria bacterium]
MSSFVAVADVDRLSVGKTMRVECQGRKILIANVEGVLHAVDDTCTHEDSSLSLGCLKGELIHCTLHGSRFSVRTGEPMEEPATESLRVYAVKVDAGKILLAPEA